MLSFDARYLKHKVHLMDDKHTFGWISAQHSNNDHDFLTASANNI